MRTNKQAPVTNSSKYFMLLFVLLHSLSGYSKHPIKVACIGASITAGARLENPERNSYPAQLQRLVGDNYTVTNYGESSSTLLKKGDHSYWNTEVYKEALASNPDVVLIDLGGNDSKLVNRIYLNEYVQDYKDFIQSFKQLPSHPRIVLMLPIVSFVTDSTQIWNPVIQNKIIPKVRQVAYEENVEVIDVYSIFINRPELLPDQIHPNLEGTTRIAKRISEIILQERDPSFAILNKLKIKSTQSSFYGYTCYDFDFNGHAAKIVIPKVATSTHSWIWRARFWGHEPQADIALLEHGFHLVYCDVSELFGNNVAVKTWNDFYATMNKAGLSDKVAFEGMSRGAVYVYNWAAENPKKVACVYADNALLDLRSWPGSQYKTHSSNQTEWEIFKKDYGYTSDEEAMKFKGSPIDKVEEIVRGHYPMLHLSADDDEALSPAENTLLFEKKIIALKGNITVLHKPGFKHHPHSLPDPTPIVDFIIHATRN